MGLERIIELLKQGGPIDPELPHAYMVMVGEGTLKSGLRLAELLRSELPGLRVTSNMGDGSFKAQFKRADKSGALVALVIGEEEAESGAVTIKRLREDAPQETVSEAKLAQRVQEITGL